MKTGMLIITKCIFAKYSLQHGSSSPFLQNGKVTQLEDLILLLLTEMKKTRIMEFQMILMIDGLTIHSSESQLKRGLKSL